MRKATLQWSDLFKAGSIPGQGHFIPLWPNGSCHFLQAVQCHWPPAGGLREIFYALLILLFQREFQWCLPSSLEQLLVKQFVQHRHPPGKEKENFEHYSGQYNLHLNTNNALVGRDILTATKCTVHPVTVTPASRTCSWAFEPLNEGSKDGWMLSIFPGN